MFNFSIIAYDGNDNVNKYDKTRFCPNKFLFYLRNIQVMNLKT